MTVPIAPICACEVHGVSETSLSQPQRRACSRNGHLDLRIRLPEAAFMSSAQHD
jgi:hypothetical protein